jgi:hypothetical protein
LARSLAVSINSSVPTDERQQPGPYLDYISLNLDKFVTKPQAKTTCTMIVGTVYALASLASHYVSENPNQYNELDDRILDTCMVLCHRYDPPIVFESLPPSITATTVKMRQLEEVLRYGQMVAAMLVKLLLCC